MSVARRPIAAIAAAGDAIGALHFGHEMEPGLAFLRGGQFDDALPNR